MTYANGRLPNSALTTVSRGMRLANHTAAVFLAMKAEAKGDGYPYFDLAYDAGGYRSYWLQGDMHVHPSRHNLSKASGIAIAAPGHSSHGEGTRMDLIGAPLDYIIRLAERYGCTREFGAADPNHFIDHGTWRPTAKVGKTLTSINGKPGSYGHSNCWKRMQLLARKGGYSGRIDGVLGTLSWAGVQQELHTLGFYHGEIDGAPAALTYTALQLWAGVRKPSRVTTWVKLPASSWRAIGKKLNTL